MKREAIALEIFLRKPPTVPLRDDTRAYYVSTIKSALETADLFLSTLREEALKSKEEQQAIAPEAEL